MSKEIPVLIKPLRESKYPGYKGGYSVTENLCLYREGVTYFPGTEIINTERLAFDIERLLTWDRLYGLLPFRYSMMIDAFYPVINRRFRKPVTSPTLATFDAAVRTIPGHVYDDTRPYPRFGIHQFEFPADNLFVNWSLPEKNTVCIGVIQKHPVMDLETVITHIVPRAVAIFNRLCPTRQIQEDTVAHVSALAKEASHIQPVLRE